MIYGSGRIMSRLIIISNRLPFSIEKTADQVRVRQSSGGLVSAIKSYFEAKNANAEAYSEKIWIGSMDAEEQDWKKAHEEGLMKADFAIVPVFPEKKTYDLYYNGFSNSTLWPLFHYFPGLVEVEKDYYEAYQQINKQFSEAVLNVYQEGDVIWVHDYQLLLLPHMLREKLPDATIGFFLHIPFPSYELFRMLPTKWKQTLL
jgi:trehalose 6-phosphate synthase/phosphatase